ncbi:HAMP domain-containing sensor histidine kinase [Oscillospiraceae bacterium PP1C4]
MSIHSRIFLPLLLVLILLPLATYWVFARTASDYVQGLAENQLKSLLQIVQPIVDDVFVEPEDADTMTAKESRAVDQAQAKEFILKIKAYIRKENNPANLIILSYKFSPVYPKDLTSQLGSEKIYAYYTAQFASNPQSLESGMMQTLTLDGQQYLVRIQKMENAPTARVKYLIAYSPIYDTENLISGAAKLVLLITAFFAAMALFTMWLTARSISKPIKRLCDHAVRIGKGNFDALPNQSGLREINELTGMMNHMAEQLHRNVDAQKAFFQNASHELRTPLMSICGYAQGIQCGVFNDNSQAAETIITESMRLTELVDGILTLSRMDSDRQPLALCPICLCDFLSIYLKKLEGMALGNHIALIQAEIGDTVYVEADESLLAQAVTNVTSNCVRYAKTSVQIRTEETANGRVKIIIEDDGPGFSPEDTMHLFERFYKGKGGQFGLGLSIAQSSMHYMGGEIKAYNSGQGAVFELSLKSCGKASA